MATKIRLWRGPCDGRVLTRDYASSTILVRYRKKHKRGSDAWYKDMQEGISYAHLDPKGEIILPDNMQAVYHKTGYQHPDGSIFYEWDGSKAKRYPSSIF